MLEGSSRGRGEGGEQELSIRREGAPEGEAAES